MNAAVHILDDLNFTDPVTEPEQELQRQLANELARARTKRASIEHELREVEGELQDLAPQRERHQLVVEACAALEKLAAVGGDTLFWGAETSSERATEHVQAARARVAQLGEWFAHMEGRQAALRDQIKQHTDTIDAIERALFEVQYEEEQLSYEWEIEREIDEKPRKALLSWAYNGEDDKRFRKSAWLALLVTLLLSAIVAQITLPPLVVNGQEVPQRVVRLLEEKKIPPPAPVEMPKPKVRVEKKPVEQPVQVAKAEPKVEQLAPKEPEVKDQGILAFRERLAAANDDQVVGRLGSKASIDNSDYAGRAQRSMLTTNAPGSSGGINLASLSRGVGRGNGNGGGMAGVAVTRASSAIASVGKPGGDRPVAGDVGVAGRTDEEIQIVFDRYKSALYRLYNKELRRDPTLKGQVILKLTIEPDGTVSLCELKSSDMNAPELTAQVVDRVKGFDFGAKPVPAITILYPIDFLPAA
ncbi:MAG TPA: AgmX/PglI C-terminal domain-containing protein [Steroidobacteraceae bacterium]|jgi:outer membrane biosynthesis protein TonB|nr:AgmX/PglI C-terminal domain-containing protein [Steroidobacteraceae bacterium]